MPKGKTWEEFLIEGREKLPDHVTIIGCVGRWSGVRTKLKLCCAEHGVWETTTAQNVLTHGTNCKLCANENLRRLRSIPWEEYRSKCQDSAKDPVTVVDFIPPWNGNMTKLKLTCELHGEWSTTTITNFIKRGTCPTCARLRVNEKQTPKWEDELKLCEQVKKDGISILGFIPPYTGTKTKLHLCCEEHGEWSTTAIVQFKNGVSCPKCAQKTIGDKNSKSDEEHIAEFFATGVFKDGCKFWKSPKLTTQGWAQYWYHTCPICSEDEFVKAGLCTGIFESHASLLKKGLCRCRCSDFPSYTEEQQDYRTKLKCEEFGYTFIERKGKFAIYSCPEHGIRTVDWQNLMQGHKCNECANKTRWDGRRKAWEEYKKECEDAVEDEIDIIGYVEPWNGCYTKLICVCAEHGEWRTTSITTRIRNLVSCPACAGRNQRQAYINTVFDGSSPVAYKLGIARDSDMRLKGQNRLNKLQMKRATLYEFPSPQLCRGAEDTCKKVLECGIVSKQDMPDGWTETVALTDYDKVVSIYESFGGVRVDTLAEEISNESDCEV
nr:MAG TPA: hypothetical protein [Caudoviricetes sp.]